MAQRKVVKAMVRLLVPAGQAKPAPPVGPALGSQGLNIMAFCKEFNAKTADYKAGVMVPVKLKAFEDKTFEWEMTTPPATYFIKQAAGIESGSNQPGHEVAGSITLKQLYEIALIKQQDQPWLPVEKVYRSLMGTVKSMGLALTKDPEGDEQLPEVKPKKKAAEADDGQKGKGKKAK